MCKFGDKQTTHLKVCICINTQLFIANTHLKVCINTRQTMCEFGDKKGVSFLHTYFLECGSATRADFVLSQSTRLFMFLPSSNQNAQNVKT